MMIDPDTAHSLSRHLMAVGFVTAATSTAACRRIIQCVFYSLALIETYAKLRYPFHLWMKDVTQGTFFTGTNHSSFQIQLLIALLVSGIVVAIVTPYLLRNSTTGCKIMTLGTLGVLGLLAVELISLHQADEFIYRQDFVFLRISWLYFLFALTAAGGAEWDRRQRKSQ